MCGGTIPPNIITTSQKPDIVIIDNNNTPKTVHLYELTCPFSTNILTANSYKKDKYAGLKDDIIQNGYVCHVIPFEICSRGFIPRRVKLTLLSMMKTFTTIKPPFNHKHIVNISKIALLSSPQLFLNIPCSEKS